MTSAGQLHAARGAEQVINFDTRGFASHPYASVASSGFLFVNLRRRSTADSRTVAGASSPAEVGPPSRPMPRVPGLRLSQGLRLRANWKNSVENYSECFHCPISHRSLVEGALDYALTASTSMPSPQPPSRDKGDAQGYGTRTQTAA